MCVWESTCTTKKVNELKVNLFDCIFILKSILWLEQTWVNMKRNFLWNIYNYLLNLGVITYVLGIGEGERHFESRGIGWERKSIKNRRESRDEEKITLINKINIALTNKLFFLFRKCQWKLFLKKLALILSYLLNNISVILYINIIHP